MEQSIIEIDDHDIYTLLIDFDSTPLIVLKARKGYIMTEHLDISTADKLGDIAGIIQNVQTIKQALNSRIITLSTKAKQQGFTIGMLSRDFLNALY